jgi:hypothetical protein
MFEKLIRAHEQMLLFATVYNNVYLFLDLYLLKFIMQFMIEAAGYPGEKRGW